MPSPHPLAALWAAPPPYQDPARARVLRTLAAALRASSGSVRLAAALLSPPVSEATLHRWLTAWQTPEIKAMKQGRSAAGEREKKAWEERRQWSLDRSRNS